MIQEYVDTSNTSVLIGVITICIMFFVARYFLQSYDEEYEMTDNQVIGISVLISVILTIVILIVFKQYLVYQGSKTLLKDDFYGI